MNTLMMLSPADLNQLYMKGEINRTHIELTQNGFYYGTRYHFTTKDGQSIRYCVNYSGFGFSTSI